MLAVLRGEAPIPTTTTAPPRPASDGGRHRPRSARSTCGSWCATAPGSTAPPATPPRQLQREGLRERRGPGRPTRPRRPQRDPLRLVRPGQGAAAAEHRARRRPGARLPLSGTDIVLVAREGLPRAAAAPATTSAPAPTTTTLSPEAACVEPGSNGPFGAGGQGGAPSGRDGACVAAASSAGSVISLAAREPVHGHARGARDRGIDRPGREDPAGRRARRSRRHRPAAPTTSSSGPTRARFVNNSERRRRVRRSRRPRHLEGQRSDTLMVAHVEPSRRGPSS